MDKVKGLQRTLVRKYMGKRGIHGISIGEKNGTIIVYVELINDWGKPLISSRKMPGHFRSAQLKAPARGSLDFCDGLLKRSSKILPGSGSPCPSY